MDCKRFAAQIDAWLDGELDDIQRKTFEDHAVHCEACRAEMAAAEQVHQILSHLDEDVSVPLPAQAAWRNAVKQEAQKRRTKRLWRGMAAVAAAFVAVAGVTLMLNTKNAHIDAPYAVTAVEVDGVNSLPNEALSVAASGDCELEIAVEDAAQAEKYLRDIAAEYDGSVGDVTEEENAKRICVEISAENAADFLCAAESIGESASEMPRQDFGEGMVRFVIHIQQK